MAKTPASALDTAPALQSAAADSSIELRMAAALASLASQSQLRRLQVIQGIDFCSNDYLGLSHDLRLREAVSAALAGGSAVGSTGSRLLAGHAEVWDTLEAALARFARSESALYFGSGYAANVGLFSCIANSGDVIFSDRANHASIIDGLRLSAARKVIFPHLDLDFLEDELSKCGTDGQKFIAVESVFSMDGDRAPLDDLLALAERYDAELIVDEAHATGVFGENGCGLVPGSVNQSTTPGAAAKKALATVHPCGKAFAGMGAFVCGSETLKQYLVNRARTFIFSTALPPYMAAQMFAAVEIVMDADAARAHLANLSTLLRARLRDAGFDTGKSDSQIVPIVLGDNERAVYFASRLCEEGFGVRAIRPPTVPAGTSRLRLSLTAGMSMDVLDRLVDALVRVRQEVAPAHCNARD